MSEAVAQSLITAAAGFFGALVGALAAVLGPWWLRRSDRVAAEAAERLERRRSAIVEFIDAQISLSNRVIPGDEETKIRATRANRALTELMSQLGPGERSIDDWLHGLSAYGRPTTESTMRSWGFGFAARTLLSWHRGELSADELRPFRVVVVNGEVSSTFVESWPTGAEMTVQGARA